MESTTLTTKKARKAIKYKNAQQQNKKKKKKTNGKSSDTNRIIL